MPDLSKSQIDRLGERLRKGLHTEDDLRILDEFRRSFGPAYQSVIQSLRLRALFPLERPAKSTPSIVAKLQRESIKLSQMQDIAGCRIVVENRVGQDQLVDILRLDFPDAVVKDRREKPSHGYRAIHLIAKISGWRVEVQVRTALQQLWAELSEKAFDVIDSNIKYGGGPAEFRQLLENWSEKVADHEITRVQESGEGVTR